MQPASFDPQYHAARLILLVDALTGKRSKLNGLTKLAKLDFLLRYPMMLERLLNADGLSWPPGIEPTESEREAVESRMIRYRYGPWDESYYPLIGSLVGRGLAVADRDHRGATTIALTAFGRTAASQLRELPEWAVVAARCRLLADHYDVTGNKLKERIYTELPDVVDRPHRAEI
jgi:hypothetical protein